MICEYCGMLTKPFKDGSCEFCGKHVLKPKPHPEAAQERGTL